MFLTIYNFLMSLLWSSLFFGVFCLLCRDASFVRSHGLRPLLFLLLLGFFRFCLTFELPFTKIIRSYCFLPAIQEAVREPCCTFLPAARDLFVLVWALVALVLLTRLFLRLIWQNKDIRKLRRHANPAATAMAKKLSQELGVSGRCIVVTTSGLDSPAVCGFFSPTVLLPDMELSEEQLRHILRHELFHFANRDAWLELVFAVFQALFWWNPLLYPVRKRFFYFLELRCDACATNKFSQEQKIEYVDTVLSVVKQAYSSNTAEPDYAFSLGKTSSERELTSRIELIFSPNMLKRKLSPALTAAALLFLLLSYSFVIQPLDDPPPAEDLAGVYQIAPENARLIQTADGDYELYIDGEYFCSPSDEFLNYLIHGGLTIEKEY